MPKLILILLSVGMICCGQLLFKVVGLRIQSGFSVLDPRTLAFTALSFLIYASATILWIYVLRTVPLTKAYPYMALSFVLVPLFSVLLFSESVRPQYLVGTGLIVAGVVLTTFASRG